MALSLASVTGNLSWQQNKTNTGFQDSIQGLDAVSASASPAITGATPANVVYAEQRTLTAAGTQTYDLQSLTDFLNQSLTMTLTWTLGQDHT